MVGAEVLLVWLDDRHTTGKDQPYFARSTDAGVTFSADVQVGSTPMDEYADNVRVASNEGGVYIVYTDKRGSGAKDNLFLAISFDGVSFREQALADNDGVVATTVPRIVAFGSTVAVSFLEETFLDDQDQVWLTHSSSKGDDGTWISERLSANLFEFADADANQLTASDHGDMVAVWILSRVSRSAWSRTSTIPTSCCPRAIPCSSEVNARSPKAQR